MSAKILDGKRLAEELTVGHAARAAVWRSRHGRPPGLGVLLIGDNPASGSYVRSKERSALAAGFHSEVRRCPAQISAAEAHAELEAMVADRALDGLLVQLPLPPQLDAGRLQATIPPEKDVDGFHPVNAGNLLLGREGLVACTPRGVMALIDGTGIDLRGAEAVVVGRSNIVGKPLFHLLLQRGATVTVAHSKTRDLAAVCRRADLVVACCGVPGLIGGAHLKPGAIVIDVGINQIEEREQAHRLLVGQPERWEAFERKGRVLVGDVLFGEALQVAGWLTPVPGGVGPLTVAMLLDNTLLAAERGLELRR